MTVSPDGPAMVLPPDANADLVPSRRQPQTGSRERRAATRWGALAALVLVSACASHAPKLTATQEAAQYEAKAAGGYNPPGPPDDPWGPYITEASKRFDVPDRWIREVMRVESGGELYHGDSLVTSPVGAMGLMQIMPATYDTLKAELNLSDDPYDPRNSILAGASYIRQMYDLYGSPGFLAAYNAGPGTLDAYLTRNRRLPAETRRYVAMIAPYIQDSVPQNRSQADMLAMNAVQARSGAASTDDQPTEIASADMQTPQPAPASPAIVAAAPVADTRIASIQPVAAATPPTQAAAPTPEIVSAAPVETPAPVPDRRDTAIAGVDPDTVQTLDSPVAERQDRRRRAPLQEPARPVEVAMLPEPPAPPRAQANTQVAAFIPEPPAPPPEPTGHKSVFRLVNPAYAEPMAHHGSPAEWAIQLGAYGNQSQAHAVTGTARDQEPRLLAGAKPAIDSLRDGRATIYRARLTGLSREGAIAACQKLAHSRTGCMVVSPDS